MSNCHCGRSTPPISRVARRPCSNFCFADRVWARCAGCPKPRGCCPRNDCTTPATSLRPPTYRISYSSSAAREATASPCLGATQETAGATTVPSRGAGTGASRRRARSGSDQISAVARRATTRSPRAVKRPKGSAAAQRLQHGALELPPLRGGRNVTHGKVSRMPAARRFFSSALSSRAWRSTCVTASTVDRSLWTRPDLRQRRRNGRSDVPGQALRQLPRPGPGRLCSRG